MVELILAAVGTSAALYGVGKNAPITATQAALVDKLQRAVESLQHAKKLAEALYSVDMPIEPEITRIRRYIRHAKRGSRLGLSRRPASQKKLRSAAENGKMGGRGDKGRKAASSIANLQKWKEREAKRYGLEVDDI